MDRKENEWMTFSNIETCGWNYPSLEGQEIAWHEGKVSPSEMSKMITVCRLQSRVKSMNELINKNRMEMKMFAASTLRIQPTIVPIQWLPADISPIKNNVKLNCA